MFVTLVTLVTASIISGRLDPPGFSFASSVNQCTYFIAGFIM